MSTAARHPNARMAMSLASIALGMAMMAYAAVPLYRMFCRVTGYGGTTQVGLSPPARPLARTLTVRFTSNVSPDLPWEFAPDQPPTQLRIGEPTLVSYRARNLGREPLTGMATYNVTPHEAGAYFSKTHCFCFEKQTLTPGKTMHFPVSFFVDPAIVDDPDLKGIDTITLSYTFFRVEPTQSPSAERTP